MKKETILATVFGVLLGLIVAVILILVLRPSGKDRIERTKSTLTPKISSNGNLMPLEIKEPPDRKISENNTIKITGKAKKGSLIIIESPVSQEVLTNKQESFNIDFPLTRGENLITIRAYVDKTQTVPQIKTLKVYYLNE